MANHSLDPEALAAAVARADKTPEESKKAGLSPTPDTEASTPDRPLDLEKVPVADAGDDQVRTIKGWKWFLVLVAIYSTAFLYGLDNTIVADIQAATVVTFGAVEQLSWIGIGFPLGGVAIILGIGKIYGTFDAKWVYIYSIVVFVVGSALCGAAQSMNMLIVGRVIAGSGGAGMYLGVLNLIALFTTLRERPLFMAFTATVWGIGTILGPVIGGAFADSSATWRWAFYMNCVILGALAPIYLFWLPSANPAPGKTILQKSKKLDGVGMLLNAAIWVTWVMGVTFGGATWPWSDGRLIATFVVLVVLLILFTVQQGFAIFTTTEHRIFPVELLRSKTMILLFFASNAVAAGLFITIYYIPLFFQFVHGDSALSAAIRLLPFVVFVVVAALFNGAAMPRFGYYMPWYTFSGITILIGGALMYTVDASTSTAKIYGYIILIGVGSGATVQAAYSIGSAKVAGPMVPSVIGFFNIAQIGGIVHSLVISGTVFQNYAVANLQVALEGRGYSTSQIQAAIAGTQSEILTGASSDVRAAAVDAIIRAMDKVYILVIVGGALILVSSLFLSREKLFMKMVAGG